MDCDWVDPWLSGCGLEVLSAFWHTSCVKRLHLEQVKPLDSRNVALRNLCMHLKWCIVAYSLPCICMHALGVLQQIQDVVVTCRVPGFRCYDSPMLLVLDALGKKRPS